jgi:ketosteroid isomerase-like protein
MTRRNTMDRSELAAKMVHAIGDDLDFFMAHAHPDLVLEFPYAPWVGRADRVSGHQHVRAHMEEVTSSLPGLFFTDLRVMPTAEEELFVLEYVGNCPALDGYRQPYITVMRFVDDRVALFREYWDTSEILRVFSGAAPSSTT